MWQYVIESNETLPPLLELTEYTSYSFKVAFVDIPHKQYVYLVSLSLQDK